MNDNVAPHICWMCKYVKFADKFTILTLILGSEFVFCCFRVAKTQLLQVKVQFCTNPNPFLTLVSC